MAGGDCRRAWWQHPAPYVPLALIAPAVPDWLLVPYGVALLGWMTWASFISKPRCPDFYRDRG